MQKVQVLHCLDYNSECLPFFLRQKSFQRWIPFYRRAETLRVACQINLGKPAGGKTPTRPVEYLGHASTESQAEEEAFESNLSLTVYLILVFQTFAAWYSPGGLGFSDVVWCPFDSNHKCTLSFFTSFPQVLQRSMRVRSLRIASGSSR